MEHFFAKAEEVINGSTPAALCIVVDTRGSTPRKQGARMIVYADGSVFGSIGGGRKVDLLKKRFLEENILAPEDLAAIDMPIGIRLNAQTPPEIAISILAKLIDVRNSDINSNK